MAAASPVDVAVNPNDTAQQLVLWGNGRIDAQGGAVPVTGQATWYTRVDQPIAVALHITDWATSAGYILDMAGGVHDFNGATAIPSGILSGVPYVASTHRYIDWSWDPAGTGQGYVLDVYGKLYAFGGATAYSAGQMWGSPLAKKLVMQWSGTKYGIVLDARGGLHDVFGAQTFTGGAYWRNADLARDLVITTWSATPAGYLLDAWGGVHEIGAAAETFGFPYRRGADVARSLFVVSAVDPIELGEVWSGGQMFQWVSSTPPTVTAGGGTSEVQTVTITGTPTGGTFTLTYSGQTTAAIARNATASTVDTALENLSNIGAGDVTVSGGPGPGTPWVVTFASALADTDVAQMTATSSLTGGTSPAVTVTTTTPGEEPSPPATVTDTTRPDLTWTYSDPQSDSQAAWELYVFTQTFVSAHTMTDPSVHAASALVAEEGINPTTRGITPSVDLPNDTYRMYVRAQDSAGQWSAWSNRGWTQNITPPATPTGLTATADQAAYSVALSVTVATGGTADLVRFECSDDGGTTWEPVRDADAVTLAATTTATDYDPPLGVARSYRAVAYAIDPAVASTASSTASATITAGQQHVLTAVDDPTLGGAVNVQNLVEWTRPIVAGVFQGLGATYPTIVSDGPPKARRGSLKLVALDAAGWDLLEDLLEADSVLLHRDPLGHAVYFRAVGDWTQGRLAAMQHVYGSDLPLYEVQPPHLAT